MKLEALQYFQENRLEEETINETMARLKESDRLLAENGSNVEPEDGSEVTIPRFKIIQPGCRIEGATVGMFRNTLTEEEIPKLENVVFLAQQNSRALFPEDDFSGVRRCFSYDGYRPAREQIMAKTGQEPISSLCASRENDEIIFHCPYARWRNERGEADEKGKKPPLCKASIGFLGVDTEMYMPFTIIFHGTAIPIVKDFLRYINYKREESKRLGKQLQLFDFRLTIGLVLQSTAKGRFYLPSFEKKEEITDSDERALVRRHSQALQGRLWLENGKEEDEE